MSTVDMRLAGWSPRRSLSVRPAPLVVVGGGSLLLAASLLQSSRGLDILGASIVAVLGTLLAWHVRRLPLWQGTVLASVLGFIVFNRGFGYVGVQLGPVPLLVGEMTILLALVAMPHRTLLVSLLKDRIVVWLLLWFLLGCCSLALHASELTFDVAKDASLIYYPIFFYFGLASARSEERRLFVLRLFGATFLVYLVYVFGFPWDVTLQAASPRVLYDLGLFGHYNTAYVHVIGGGLFFAVLGPRLYERWPRGLALAVSALYLGTLIFVQSRAGVLGALACFAVLVLLGYHGRSLKVAAGLGAVGMIVTVAATKGFAMQGWKAPATLDFVAHMVASTFGADGGGEYLNAGLHATRESRFQMWTTTLEPNLASPTKFLFGSGFGDLLVDIELTTGWIKRSPHNSFVTVMARFGLIGLIVFLGLHLRFVRVMLRGIRRTAITGRQDSRRQLVWFLVYYVGFTFGALFSVVYDTPYMATPVYFVMGLAYGAARSELTRGRRPSGDSALIPSGASPC